MQNKIRIIPTADITANPHQPRQTFDDESIRELAESISKVGLLQPIVVRSIPGGYELIAGERRLRATRHLERKEISAIVYDVNDIGSAALALIENIQREQLNFFDEAVSYERLVSEHGLTQQQIAKLVGKSQSAVANKLRLLKHSPEVVDRLRVNGLSERHSRALLTLNDEVEKLSVIDQIVDKGLNVRDTEKLIEMRSSAIKKKRQKVTGLIKNYKLYVNTIKHAFEQVRSAGVKAHYDLTEDENEYTIMIKIEK